jgi:photosystem II stability/assembly factor-like uncharacterized protein
MKLNNMKKTRSVLTGMAALMLAFALVLTACPGDGGVEDPNPPYGSKVTEINLTGTVTAPVKGAAPVTSFSADQYTGVIAWKDADGAAVSGNFAPGTVYKAVVTLTAKDGFTFTGVGANSFTHKAAVSAANARNSGTVTITFPATAAEGADTPDIPSDNIEQDSRLTWTKVTDFKFPSDCVICGIAYGGEGVNAKFVMVGEKGRMAYSSDNGKTWTRVENSTFDSHEAITGIAYGRGIFVVTGTLGKIATSPDGTNWTARDSKINNHIKAIAYGDGTFVAVGDKGNLIRSTDGTNWTKGEFQNGAANPFHTIYNIAYGDGTFVAVGKQGKMAYSSNGGATWTAVVKPTFGSDDIYGITYGGEGVNAKFIAVGKQGKMAYSSDKGEIWTTVADTTFGSDDIYGIVYGGEGINAKFIAVGDKGKMAYSHSNGEIWKKVEDPMFKSNIASIVYGNKKFVAGLGGGTIIYSNNQE